MTTFNPDYNDKGNNPSLSEFLKALVAEGLKASSQKRPFVFSFGHDDSGHSIVAYGVEQYNDRTYGILMYDENQYNGPSTTITPITCEIDLKNNTFDFTDGNGNHITNTSYNYLSFTGIEDLFENRISLLEAEEDAYYISVSANRKVTVTNERGEYLKFDGQKYDGTINVYDSWVTGEEQSQTITFAVDPYKELFVYNGDSDSEIEVSAAIDDRYYTLTTSADGFTISKDKIDITGNDYSFTAGTASENDGAELVTVSALASGDVSIAAADDSISVNTEGTISYAVVKDIDKGDISYHEVKENTDSILITDIKKDDITVKPEKTADSSDPSSAVTNGFTDVTHDTVNNTSYNAIYWAVNNGIVKGYSDGTFKPEVICTREQFSIMLWRFAGQSDADASAVNRFTDAGDFSNGAKKAVAWAVEQGIVAGFNDGSFKPKDDITRAQVAVMLWRYAGKPDVSGSSKFSDIGSFSSGVQNAIIWLEANKIASGYNDGTFRPDGGCQRQHMAIFLYRYANNIK